MGWSNQTITQSPIFATSFLTLSLVAVSMTGGSSTTDIIPITNQTIKSKNTVRVSGESYWDISCLSIMSEIPGIEKNLRKLDRISEFQNGWNGYDAKKFSGRLINNAKNTVFSLIYQPELFPTAKNTIQLEYDGPNDTYLEFEIDETDNIGVFSIDKNGNEKYQIVKRNAETLNQMVKELYG